MQTIFHGFLITTAVCILLSCGSKNQKDKTGSGMQSDSVSGAQSLQNQAVDSTLTPVKHLFEKELAGWSRSFSGFNTDSFSLTQNMAFEETDFNEVGDMSDFYELYKPSLSFSPDSNLFIDLLSAGVMLEKKGKKIIASADVDQAVTLCNLKTKKWNRIVSFGPSAGIEEAVWISPSSFILAGVMQNDNGEEQPIVLLGDVNGKTFRWYEGKTKRPESTDYKASGMEKLKIDEWE